MTDPPRNTGPLDVYAFRELGSSAEVHPALVALVECKTADLPLIFFPPAVPRLPRGFPAILHLPQTCCHILQAGRNLEVDPAEFLCLRDFPFVSAGPTLAAAFARAERKGKSFELSGAVPFNTIVLPLNSALDHCRQVWEPVGPQKQLWPVIAVCVAVIDAAMVAARGSPERPELSLVPWVRVVREEKVQQQHWWSQRQYVVDFIHAAFVDTYFAVHLLPFADAVAMRTLQQQELLIAGKAQVPDLQLWSIDDLKPAA